MRLLTFCMLLFCLGFSGFIYAEDNTLHFIISGVDPKLLSNIQSRLQLDDKGMCKHLTVKKINTIYATAPLAMQEAIQPFGYFKSSIKRGRLMHHGNVYGANFDINPGPVLKIIHVDLSLEGPGERSRALNKFVAQFPIVAGQGLDITGYQDAKQKFFQIANSHGYIKAYFSKNAVLIDLKQYHATIIMHMQTGPRYYFGPMHFTHSPYDQAFLQRFNPFKENEPFSSEKLLALQQDMSNSGLFSQVALTPNLNKIEDNRVPIQALTTTPPTRKYSIGIGYGTFTGPRLTAGAAFNHITSSGQHLDAQLRLSSVLSGLAAKYYIPGKNPLTDQWILGSSYQKFTPKNGVSNSRSISAGYTQKFARSWNAAYNLNFLLDRFSVYDLPTKNSKLLYPGMTVSYIKADDKINPNNGKSFSINVEGSPDMSLSSSSFVQFEVKGKYKITPISFAHIILTGDFGMTGVHNLENFPLVTRFFAGGLNSIRGYQDSSIGPGKYIGVASAEYQNHILDNWFAAVFYDIGNATDHIHSKLSAGTGVGIGYESPIGPLKLYLAEAVSKEGRPHSIEFSLGPEF